MISVWAQRVALSNYEKNAVEVLDAKARLKMSGAAGARQFKVARELVNGFAGRYENGRETSVATAVKTLKSKGLGSPVGTASRDEFESQQSQSGVSDDQPKSR